MAILSESIKSSIAWTFVNLPALMLCVLGVINPSFQESFEGQPQSAAKELYSLDPRISTPRFLENILYV